MITQRNYISIISARDSKQNFKHFNPTARKHKTGALNEVSTPLHPYL